MVVSYPEYRTMNADTRDIPHFWGAHPPRRRRRSVGDERVHVGALEALAAFEKRQLDDEARPDDLRAELLDELLDPFDSAARREHVVVDHDPRSLRDQIGVQLE